MQKKKRKRELFSHSLPQLLHHSFG